jgi:hypothetical protein
MKQSAALLSAVFSLFLPLLATARAGDDLAPPLKGYADYSALTERMAQLEKSELCRVESLGQTMAGREVFLLTISKGEPSAKSAVLLVGNVEAAHLVGSELAMRLAHGLVTKNDAETKRLLDTLTFYVIPRPNPDGAEKSFARRPWREARGNARRTDDDRDGEQGEDPPEDLNGDGWITMMRVADETGTHLPHPIDPRVMVRADAGKEELGQYHLYTEGWDNDGDGELNEDAGDGVSFNRNFPFQYPYMEPAAGEYAVSETESRAVADFAFDHPNIAFVFTFTPEDNLMNVWKPNDKSPGPGKTALQKADSKAMQIFSELYKQARQGKSPPKPTKPAGSFSSWAYFQYGRWSLAARGWWIPPTPPSELEKDERQPPNDSREGEAINALRWFDTNSIAGFVDWQPLDDHPDFPGKKVEVGGFKPFYRLNPPAGELADVAARHHEFLVKLPDTLPNVAIINQRVDSLGGGVYRLSATFFNRGKLPTMPEMGKIARQTIPINWELELPDNGELITGHRRGQIQRLAERNGHEEITWLLRFSGDTNAKCVLTATSPTLKTMETTFDVSKSEKRNPKSKAKLKTE